MPRDPQDQTVSASVRIPAELASAFGFEDTFANLFISNMRARLDAEDREINHTLIHGTSGGMTPTGFMSAGRLERHKSTPIDLDAVRRELAARLMRSALRWSNN